MILNELIGKDIENCLYCDKHLLSDNSFLICINCDQHYYCGKNYFSIYCGDVILTAQYNSYYIEPSNYLEDNISWYYYKIFTFDIDFSDKEKLYNKLKIYLNFS